MTFDECFGPTLARSIEGAAVRENERPSNGEARRHEADEPRPVLIFSNGDRVAVDRPVIVGRNPIHIHEGSEDRLIRLPGERLSRQHAMIRIDRWQTIVEDLGSRHGTTVTSPGRSPRHLGPHQPVGLVAGTRVELADAVSFVLEQLA
jgi:pSer/pThr/pTyr-binding forkhead associated (FHA) protein